MPRAVAGPEIERLIQLLARVPGLGPRSARRAALHLIKKREQLMSPLASAFEEVLGKISTCRVCGNIDVRDPARSASTRPATPPCWSSSPTSPTSGRWSVPGRLTRATMCSAARSRRSTASGRRI